MLSFVILILGFLLLVWGADHFVAGASALARKLGVPPLIIGLTVVAFGTSAPELTVSVTAGLAGSNEIAISNVLGSNLFNLLVVAGGCAIFSPLVTERDLLRRDWPASIVATIVLAICITMDGVLSRMDGLLLLAGFVVILGMQISAARSERSAPAAADGEISNETRPLIIAFNIFAGLAAIVAGGQFSVDGATEIARILGLSETIIGLTVVAIGTSLPELVTSIAATRRGENSIAVGNVVGSNLFNLFLILGISSSLTPIVVEFTAIMDTLLLLAVSVIMLFLAKTNRLGRSAGITLVLSYVAFTAWIILR